jgi:hypothetical protein
LHPPRLHRHPCDAPIASGDAERCHCRVGHAQTLDFLHKVQQTGKYTLYTIDVSMDGSMVYTNISTSLTRFVSVNHGGMVVKAPPLPEGVPTNPDSLREFYDMVTPEDPVWSELRGNAELIARLVSNNKLKRELVTSLASPFCYLSKRKTFVAGIVATDRNTHRIVHSFPVYRRMMGDVSSFYQAASGSITVNHILTMIMSTLQMLKLLQGVGANHMDIKECNMLFEVACNSTPRSTPSTTRQPTLTDLRDALVKPSSAGCDVRFVLSNFGGIMFNTHPHKEGESSSGDTPGTPGMIGPSRLYNTNQGAKLFSATYSVPPSSGIDKASVWESYRSAMRKDVSRFKRFQKSDLYALGVMLFSFHLTQPQLKHLRQFAIALIKGRASDIWDIDTALSKFRELRLKHRKDGDDILLGLAQ